MRSTSKYCIYTLFASVFLANQLSAQAPAKPYADIDYVRKSNAWLSSKNAAGLNHFNTESISNAEFFFKKENGGFKNYFQSDDSQEYGLQADSYTRLNDKVVFSGGFGYQNFQGKNMSGSAFMDPYQNPFDIVELDDANKGTKALELYNLNGAVSAQVSSRWSVGGKLAYQAGNYAKRKDLRHINKLLDMDLSAGALYKISDLLEIGANYNYSRRIESVGFKIAGTKDQVYNSLISYGSFYGLIDRFDDSGYTSATNPLKDIRQGGALQLNLQFNKNVTLFNEFSYADRNGFFGDQVPASITKHNGSDFAYHGQLSVKGNDIEHHIGLKGSHSLLSNRENISLRETTPGGINLIVLYGDKEVFSGMTTHIGLNYDLFFGVKNNRPTWAINFGADFLGRDQTSGLYPFYRDQKINSYQFSGQVKRQYERQKGAFNIGVGLAYGRGGGEIANSRMMETPAPDYVPLVTMTQFLNEEYEFLTSSRIKGSFSFQYTRPLENNMSAFVKLNYAHTYAPEVTYLDKHFNATHISIGCNF